jgi:spoIIIJ-associated protein
MSVGTDAGREQPARDDLIVSIEDFLGRLIGNSRLQLGFACERRGKVVRVELSGEDADVVLGNSARLLYAVNHLLHQIFFRHSPEGYSVEVDCCGYRSTRVLELRLLAEKAAEKALYSGTVFPLQPMPAAERRIIHLALADHGRVRTESRGDGLQRHVVIVPAR